MKTDRATVSQIAYCEDCRKEWEEYKNFKARKAAYKHAKKTGHRVSVETTVAISYNH